MRSTAIGREIHQPIAILLQCVRRLLKEERNNEEADQHQKDSKRQFLRENNGKQQGKCDRVYFPVNRERGAKSTGEPARLRCSAGSDEKKRYDDDICLSVVQTTQRQGHNK